MLSIRSHGWTRHLPHNSKLYQKSENDFYESFNFIMPGYNLRPIEMEAAIGREQLRKMDDIISVRRKNASLFQKKMELLSDYYLVQKECEKSSWFGFAVILKGKLENKREALIEMLEENEVEVRPIVAGNFTKSPSIKYIKHEIVGELKNANTIHDSGFFVGNHCRDNSENINMFVRLLEKFVKEYE